MIRRLKSLPETMDPVLRKANNYIACKECYAYEQILLLVFLSLTRKLTLGKFLDWIVRGILDAATSLLVELVEGHKEPMICSEFVYRSYEEAVPLPNDHYTLNVKPMPVPVLLATGMPEKLQVSLRHFSVGIHKDSLLAWASNVVTEPVRSMPQEFKLSLESPVESIGVEPFDEKKFNEIFEKYLSEVKKPSREALKIEPSIRTADMLGRIKKFADAYYQATAGVNKKKEMKLSWVDTIESDEVPEPLEYLLKAAADFVTPGDLLKCDSLFNVGKIIE